jgi:hypothetical protein
LAYIFFRVAVSVSEREELHELAGQILVRRACAVATPSSQNSISESVNIA